MSNVANINAISMSTVTGYSWRTAGGIKIDVGGMLNDPGLSGPSYQQRAGEFLDALKGSFPEVNTIRVDFNIYTLNDSTRLGEWKSFASQAADRGYKLIIVNSDGAISNSKNIVDPNHEDYLEGALPNVKDSGIGVSNYVDDISQHWNSMLAWFHGDDQESILDAVYGWEIMNEPVAYVGRPGLYAKHVRDIINENKGNFNGAHILVGGINASVHFEGLSVDTDLNLIREAAGGDLIWSAHMYPGTLVSGAGYESSDDHFNEKLESFLKSSNHTDGDNCIWESEDNIIITETQLHTGYDHGNADKGSLIYNSNYDLIVKSFNFQQAWNNFAERGIGVAWWGPVDLASSLFAWYDNTKYTTYAESAALAHEMWSYKESADSIGSSEHYGTSVADSLAVGGNDPDFDRITEGLMVGATSNDTGDKRVGDYGLIFGFDGNDTIIGSSAGQGTFGGVDMLYGGAGNDSILGMGGNDYLFGGEGADTIWGGEGHDTIIDRSGGGEARGGAGDDYIQIAGGKSYGDDGNDTLLFSSNGNQTAYGGSGADTFVAMGNGQIGVKDFSAADADKLSLAFWADDPDVERIIVMLHHNGQGEATGSLVVSNEVGGSYRVFGGYSSSSPLDFAATNFVDAEGVWIAYRYFDGVENKIAYRIADGGNVTAFDPTASDYSDGKLFGNATNEVIVLDEDAQFWGGAGRDIFVATELVATELNVRIRDFNVSADSDYIDLSAWNLSGPDELQISDRLTGGGAPTNEVYIHDEAGHNIRVALYGGTEMSEDMFIF